MFFFTSNKSKNREAEEIKQTSQKTMKQKLQNREAVLKQRYTQRKEEALKRRQKLQHEFNSQKLSQREVELFFVQPCLCM